MSLAQAYVRGVDASGNQMPYGYPGVSRNCYVAGYGQTPALNGATAVTVNASAVQDNAIVLFNLRTAGGTVGSPFIGTITPGTSFTVASQALDTSVYNYVILNPLPDN